MESDLKKFIKTRHPQEADQILKALFADAIDGIITIDAQGIVEAINPAAAKLFDYPPEAVIGHNIKMLMPSPYHEEHDGYIERYHHTHEPRIIGIGREVRGRKKDGSIFPFFLSVSEIQLEDRKIFAGIIHDISDIKQKEKELLYSQNQFKAIFESAVDAIIIINQHGIIQIANPATAQLFGYSIEQMVSHNINLLMDSPDRERHDGYINRYLDTKEAHIIGKGREVQARHKNGHTFPIMLAVSEIQLEQETFFVGLIHDLSQQKEIEDAIRAMNEELEGRVNQRTEELSKVVNKLLSTNKQLKIEISERKKVEEALIESQKELRSSLEKEKELNELKSRFVSMASHEFRTPLSTILSSASLIGKYTEGAQQDRRQKHIDRIKSMVNTLTGVLNDFLSLSKLEEGRIQVVPEHFAFNAFCKTVFDEVWPLLKAKQDLKHVPLPEEVEVFHDKQLIRNILFNLISNAIKYSPDGSIIHCRTQLDKDKLHLEIQDHGMGIPEADQKHLFTRFFRASNSVNIQGTGLGLNIVRSYIDLLKGEISFKSVEGQGTTFYVEIPTQYQS